MNTTTLTAIIGVIATLLGIFGQITSLKKTWEETIKKQAERDAHIDAKIDEMQRQLNEHNRYSDKISGIEKSLNTISTTLAELKTDVKWLREK